LGERRVPGCVLVWDVEQLDAMTEAVVQRVLIDGSGARAVAVGLAAELAATRPDLPALALALPFSLAAGGLEEMLGAAEDACAAAHRAWRMAALIGAEVLALQAVLGRAPTMADLAAHFRADAAAF